MDHFNSSPALFVHVRAIILEDDVSAANQLWHSGRAIQTGLSSVLPNTWEKGNLSCGFHMISVDAIDQEYSNLHSTPKRSLTTCNKDGQKKQEKKRTHAVGASSTPCKTLMQFYFDGLQISFFFERWSADLETNNNTTMAIRFHRLTKIGGQWGSEKLVLYFCIGKLKLITKVYG